MPEASHSGGRSMCHRLAWQAFDNNAHIKMSFVIVTVGLSARLSHTHMPLPPPSAPFSPSPPTSRGRPLHPVPDHHTRRPHQAPPPAALPRRRLQRQLPSAHPPPLPISPVGSAHGRCRCRPPAPPFPATAAAAACPRCQRGPAPCLLLQSVPLPPRRLHRGCHRCVDALAGAMRAALRLGHCSRRCGWRRRRKRRSWASAGSRC